MAGYYDPNKDYSKELQRTDLTASQRSQLETERSNKINDKYGGVEPNMTGSNKTYTQLYGGNSGGSSSGSSSGSSGGYSGSFQGVDYEQTGTGVYGTPIIDSTKKNYTSGGVTYQVGPDMSRRTDLAGQTAISNGYTVFYNSDGYAYKASKGAADYLPSQDFYVKNGTYNGGNLWTDEEMVSASDLAAIQNIRNQLNSGQLTAAQANQLANQIRSGYGYTIDTAGNVYDSGVQSAVAARRQQLGLDTGTEDAATAYYRYLMGTDTSPYAQQTGQVKSYAQWAAENGYPNGTVSGSNGAGAVDAGLASGLTTGGSSGSSGSTGGRVSDMTAYINDLYAQQLEAELAALKAAYDSNVAEVESQNDKIAEQYRTARNQAAAQNALESQRMNEMGLAQGLNTGASGQMALAQNAAYQGNLGNLWASEAQEQADVDLLLAQLLQEYNSNVQQTTASSNAQKAQALYQEMIRQQELAQQQTSTAREYALNLLSSGIMPDSATLSTAGISSTEASAIVQLAQQQTAASTTSTKPSLTWAQVKEELANGNTSPAVLAGYEYYMGQAYPTGGTSGTTGTTAKTSGGSSSKKLSGYNNGSLTTAQVKTLQDYYGVSSDGKWGANSKKAAGGLTADEAWAAYNKSGKTGSGSITATTQLSQTARQKLTSLQLQARRDNGINTAQRDSLVRMVESGEITEAELEYMMKVLGI